MTNRKNDFNLDFNNSQNKKKSKSICMIKITISKSYIFMNMRIILAALKEDYPDARKLDLVYRDKTLFLINGCVHLLIKIETISEKHQEITWEHMAIKQVENLIQVIEADKEEKRKELENANQLNFYIDFYENFYRQKITQVKIYKDEMKEK